MDWQRKIIPLEQLPAWRSSVRASGKKLAVTNGCFDVLHVGHVICLAGARDQADLLLVGLNSDRSVRELKGPGRPVNSENDRAIVLAALECVDAVAIFNETEATKFLELAQPDVYVKGGDYSVDQLNSSEKAAVERSGGRIVIIPMVPGKSTTAILRSGAS